MKQYYVAGFLYSMNQSQVLLISKLKPEWQKGLLNGIGGKIEEGEQPALAIIREFKEETGMEINSWKHKVTLVCRDGVVFFFSAYSNDLTQAESMEEEKVKIVEIKHLHNLKTMPNLKWLIPLCMDKHLQFPIVIQEKYVNPCLRKSK